LGHFGLELARKRGHDWSDVANYIPFEATIEAARKAGVSVGDYIDGVREGITSTTQATMDQMAQLGLFAGILDTVVEIGPGSGRYLERTLKLCNPQRYEIYETAAPWAAYLEKKYQVILQPTDGKSLAGTPSGSVDLVQAHKVFSTIPFLATARYWLEMVRVTRPGGFAVFDIVTEACMAPDMLESWVASGRGNASYPAMVPTSVAVGLFESHGFSLMGRFIVPMGPGSTEAYVFKKGTAAPAT
jgi:hypothetical protein